MLGKKLREQLRSGLPPNFTPRPEKPVKREFERDPSAAAFEVARKCCVSGQMVQKVLRGNDSRCRSLCWGAVQTSRQRQLMRKFVKKARTWRQGWTEILSRI